MAALALLLVGLFLHAPGHCITGVVAVVSAGFVVSIFMRTVLVLLGRYRRVGSTEAEWAWPVYSVLVPLFHEVEVLPQLVQSLCALDYPKDKLDIRLILEEDDVETRAAVAQAPFACVVVPPSRPKTKPKAANYAAHFAGGEFLVVFDAEDRPEPDQLKKAVRAFRANPDIDCFQARLRIDRCRNWLQRMFALDYGIWFNALLPGLEYLSAPIPLGGTSNHFRRASLLKAGLWDPYNVTEDADLGLRLARLGFRVGILDSVTWEEAPQALGVWLRQRTRWMKGYMQTLLVHWRQPRRFIGDVGPIGAFTIHMFLGGAVWSALVNPLLWIFFAVSSFGQPAAPDLLARIAEASGFTLLLVNALLAQIGRLQVSRSEALPPWYVTLSYPLYWLLISVAGWRALYQLVRDPFLWEKTPHGASLP
ncbi:cellulose synthase/poly-beta-1,6-N-acetylglucosamine synthase-like glycosyltransferase [Rhizomicrobium palustre]|uniref:Cellulose synthase/poly-beta-1,6-N-acetylglucosamine synthase-like glycosyltransferase n=1 Tax=Rhizomicrobium palustre TaxID=189966 RepID=A0A846N199_9PROT|nr:glycosyltransferase [Rhizomicrobium palustre]NIK89744.1 cellulose synthase/poly-beta-1,6-N-acetylglucosamine synthase-like glycosyltransferase [Rhizomicrobium palustre]